MILDTDLDRAVLDPVKETVGKAKAAMAGDPSSPRAGTGPHTSPRVVAFLLCPHLVCQGLSTVSFILPGCGTCKAH